MTINTTQLTEGIGFLAAACTTLAFVPQLMKIRRSGGRDLSYGMLTIYLSGLALWLIYGLRLHAEAVIAANAIALVLVGAALAMKHEMERPEITIPPAMLPEVYACDNPLELFPAYPSPPAETEKVQALAYAARRH